MEEQTRRKRKAMRCHLLLAKGAPKAMAEPSKCASGDCTGKRVQLHQPLNKALEVEQLPGRSRAPAPPQPRGQAGLWAGERWNRWSRLRRSGKGKGPNP